MKSVSVKYFHFNLYILFSLLISFCANELSCDHYFENDEFVICTKVNGENDMDIVGSPGDKVAVNCHNEHYVDYPSQQTVVEFKDCTFENYDYLASLQLENASTVLKNDAFRHLCDVTVVRLGNADIEFIEPDAFHCLKSLVNLFLAGNRIEVLHRDVFKDMEHLTSLDLSFNRLRTLPNGMFHNLKELRVLWLNDNELETLGHLPFSDLVELSHLFLQNNKLRNLEKTFSNNPRLEVLEVANNAISFISRTVFLESENLEIVDLYGNQLQRISPSMFGTLKKLHTLTLACNGISELVGQPFINNSKIEELDLWGNNISQVMSGNFRGLLSLRTLNIGWNAIERIATDSLSDLPSLNKLNLDSNRLLNLNSLNSQQYIFANKKLRKLVLSENKLKNLSNAFGNSSIYNLDLSRNIGLLLSNNTFAGLKGLQVLHLEGCYLTNIPDGIFANVPKLTQIHLRNNSIHVVKPVTLAPLKRIRSLDLSYNKLRKLSDNLFINNVLLRLLNLSNNDIEVVGKKAFRGLNSTLWELDISSNSILDFPPNDLALNVLNISCNQISTLNGIVEIGSLTKLDVSYNNLSIVTKEHWRKILSLDSFIGANNKIENVYVEKNRDAKINCTLHLEYNRISNIVILESSGKGQIAESNLFSKETPPSQNNLYSSLKFYTRGNYLNCNCFAYSLYDYLNSLKYSKHTEFVDDLICHNPPKLRCKMLKGLKPTDFTCNYVEDPSKFQCTPDCICMGICSCSYRPYENFRIVNCSNRNYSELPLSVPRYTSSLDMSHNFLTSLAQLNEPRWGNLREVHVENNGIDSAEFRIPPDVTYLGLKGNRLKTFPTAIHKHADKMKNFKVTLSDNLWPCDCSAMALKRFLLTHNDKVLDIENVRCIFANRSRVLLKTAKDVDLCPRLQDLTKTIILNVTSAFFILISVSLTVFYYTNKQYILLFLYTHCHSFYRLFCCDKVIEEPKRFDGFISYCSEDRDVPLAIIEELENKPPKYLFCIHERNWLAGYYITRNILNSVRNSRKTLIVLSKAFLESEWFQLEFQAAFYQTLQDKKDRIILILKGDLPDRSLLHEDVRYVLSTKTYLRWGDRWFFEKLRYAMHERSLLDKKKKAGTLRRVLNCFFRKRLPSRKDIEMRTV